MSRLRTAAVAAVLTGGVMASAAVAKGSDSTLPKPFHVTGVVRSVDATARRIEMDTKTAGPRHFKFYTLAPQVTVKNQSRGQAKLSDVDPKMRVRLSGQRTAGNTWRVDEIDILPSN